jgi:alpha-amylase/alpha-mannosidase (GH57 family)
VLKILYRVENLATVETAQSKNYPFSNTVLNFDMSWKNGTIKLFYFDHSEDDFDYCEEDFDHSYTLSQCHNHFH